MKRNYLPGPRLQVEGIVPLEMGGTGADNLPDARTNLGIVPKSQMGQAEGLIPLDQFGKFSPSYLEGFVFSTVDVDGPKELFTDEVGVYKITNMDSRINYTVHADVGTISIEGDTITYIAPPTHIAPGGFSVNSSYYNIPIRGPVKIPNAPTITDPDNDLVTNTSSYVFVSSVWSSNYPEDYLATVEWEFSTYEDFSYPLANNITVDKQGYVAALGNIPPNTVIYARVRHRGFYGYNSEWSPVRIFTRPEEQKPLTPVIISPTSDGVTHEARTEFIGTDFQATATGDTLAEALWQASTSDDFSTALQEFRQTGSEANRLVFEKLRDRQYFVRVKYKGTSHWESEWSDNRVIMYVPIEPAERPTIISPGVNTVVTAASTVLEATPFSAGAASDQIDEATWEVSKTGDFAIVMESRKIQGSEYFRFQMSGMVPGETYFFRVRYRGTTGWYSQWSLVRSITYGAIERPSLISPLTGTERLKLSVNFFSSAFKLVGLSDAHMSSDWQLSESISFLDLKEYVSESTVDKTTWAVNSLEYGKTYYVRVRYRGSGYTISDWSPIVTIHTREAAWSPLKIADIETGANNTTLSVNNDGNIFATHNRIYRYTEAGPTLIKSIGNQEAFGTAEMYLSSSTIIGHAVVVSQVGNSVEVVSSAYIPDAVGAVPKSLLAYAKYGYSNGNLIRTEHFVTANPLVELSEDPDAEAVTPIHNFQVVGSQALGNNHTRVFLVKSATGGTGIYHVELKKTLIDSFVPVPSEDTFALVEYPETQGQDYVISLNAVTGNQPQRQQTPSGYFENESTGTLLNYYHEGETTPSVSMSLEVAEAITRLNVAGQWVNHDMSLLMSRQGSRLLIYSNN